MLEIGEGETAAGCDDQIHDRPAQAQIGVLAIAVLQILLIAGVLSFDQQVGPVSVAFFGLFGGWLLITGYLGRGLQALPRSMLMSFVGWTYVGYPIWAFWLGGRLRSGIRD